MLLSKATYKSTETSVVILKQLKTDPKLKLYKYPRLQNKEIK